MKMLRLLTIALSVLALSACSWFKKEQKGSARMYDGDESPAIRLYDEGPGSELHN